MTLRRIALAGAVGAVALAPAAPAHAAVPLTTEKAEKPLHHIVHVARKQARAEQRRKQARIARRQAAATPPQLQAIAACESGGNPRAVDASGTYRGKYQFDRGTWASVGGAGDPAAAPEAEQDRRAAILYARAGASPWPICGA
jgi:transglycosylase-like protein